MAYKFLIDNDFPFKIRQEIKNIIAGDTPALTLETAENVAISQIKKYLGGRYDMELVFSQTGTNRDAYIINVVLVILVYLLYTGSTGMKDIPTTRKEEYGDIMEWLTNVGSGKIPSDLPSLITDEVPGDVRLNSQEQQAWDY